MPKSNRKKLIEKLDKVFSVYIRQRDGRCVICGKTEGLTNGHLFSRINYSTRWDELNCHCQCSGCNYSHEFKPYPFFQWFENKFGKETLDNLYKKLLETRKWKDWEIQELIDKYQGLLGSKDLPF